MGEGPGQQGRAGFTCSLGVWPWQRSSGGGWVAAPVLGAGSGAAGAGEQGGCGRWQGGAAEGCTLGWLGLLHLSLP